ncbi:FtsX-like permease family protein [Myxococcota bacterium]|nr:FtsX-like permease family protein [Myxococcota bacterium]MBU1431654.1 FtsX-like permease family protein [Myxococcota bacterium]MBU1900015.1 FtsX-like permease family protein [Myxococcota bacterium]
MILAQIALRNLLQGGARVRRLIWAIAAAVALLTLLSALSSGLEATLIRATSALMSGHVNVGGFYKVTRDVAAPLIPDAPRAAAVAREVIGDRGQLATRLRGFGRLISPKGAFHAGLIGVALDEEVAALRALPAARGAIEGLRRRDALVLFARQAARLGVGVGDHVILKAQTGDGAYNSAELEVVAVLEDVGFLSAWVVLTHREALRDLYQLRASAAGVIQIHLNDPFEALRVEAALRRALIEEGMEVLPRRAEPYFVKMGHYAAAPWRGARLDLSTWQDEAGFLLWLLGGLWALRWGALGLLMTLIGVAIMNTFWLIIRERHAEIGALRALGLSREGVAGLLLMEGALLGLAGALLGALLGGVAALILDAVALPLHDPALRALLMQDHLSLRLDPLALFSLAGAVLLMTTLAVLPPAMRAARSSPAEAMSR